MFFMVLFRNVIEALVHYSVAGKNNVVILKNLFGYWKIQIVLKQKWMLQSVSDSYMKRIVMNSTYSLKNGFRTNNVSDSSLQVNISEHVFIFLFSFEGFSKSEDQFEIGDLIQLVNIWSEHANNDLWSNRKNGRGWESHKT